MPWIIICLAGINFLKLILEILLYRGLRVPFAQLFSIISYLAAIFAFLPLKLNIEFIYWQWELAAFSILTQWFNVAFTSRSIPFIGNFIVMFQSILINCFSLIFIIFPLLIGFSISTKMIFYNQISFMKITPALYKLSAMLIGEFSYENLFFSKPSLTATFFIFIPFIAIMTIVFMNLLLGLAVGDIKGCMKDAEAKARKNFSFSYV